MTVRAAHPSHTPLTKIREFATILDQAVQDALLDQSGQGRVTHLWDDDSLYLPLRGFVSLGESHQQQPSDMVAQALFASGFLGTVSLLAPHRSELLAHIATWARERSMTEAAFKAKAREFLRRPEVSAVQNIAESLTQVDDLDEESVERALERLRALEPLSFVYVEALSGGWIRRVKRLVDESQLLDLSLLGPPTESLLASDNFNRLAERLSHQRGGTRPLSTAIDAAALTSLMAMTEDVRTGQSDIHPRFFTSSPTLKRLYAQEPWVRQALEYHLGSRHHQSTSSTAWRESTYYYLRALFPALRLDAAAGEKSEGASLDELELLCSNLHEALGVGSSEALALVSDYKVQDDITLADLVTDLESSRMSRIWLRYSKSVAENLLESLRAIGRVDDADKEHRVVETLEGEFVKKLQSELEERRLCVRMVDAIAGAITQLDRAGQQGYLSLRRDLAALRWGVQFDDERDRIALHTAAGSDAYRELLQVYDIDVLRRDVTVAERTMAVLLGLEKFDLARDVLASIGDAVSSDSLNVMSMVARLGSKDSFNEDQLLFAVQLLQAQWKQLDDKGKIRLGLSYGYAAHVAWSRSVHGGAWGMKNPKDDNGWARWSVDIVYDRLSMQDEWGLIYGVNHVVYVATRAELDVPRLHELAADLERFAVQMDEYRFLDTVGYRLYRDAARDVSIDRSLAEGKLERALEYLARASQLATSDVEIRQHLELAEELDHKMTSPERD
jgi:hypothetical protein